MKITAVFDLPRRRNSVTIGGVSVPYTDSDDVDLVDRYDDAVCARCSSVGRTTTASVTLRIGLEDRSGTIDLCSTHVLELRALMEPMLAASAARNRRRPPAESVPRLHAGEDREAIRAWARRRGLPVSTSGTISAAVLDRYRADTEGATVSLP
jgi:hypothetical protein